MADTAAHLVDRVLPRVPGRQWVLSLPFGLRFAVAFDRKLCRQVRTVFMETVPDRSLSWSIVCWAVTVGARIVTAKSNSGAWGAFVA